MAIPDYQTLIFPLLKFVSDGNVYSIDAISNHLAELFKLTQEEKEERIPSGQSTYIKNRTGWARTYLKKAGLLSSPISGGVKITPRGMEVLTTNPESVDNKFLKQFPEFVEFYQRENSSKDDTQSQNIVTSLTPEEAIEKSYFQLRSLLADELLDKIKLCTPAFFERLVVNLLVAMGYGGSYKDAARATQSSKDGGIDGIIKQDRLGLDNVYIQAKKWDEKHSVHRPEIRKFVGALHGVRARKGIFITTSFFSEGARDYVASVETKIVLIDGSELAQLMIDYGIGVTPHQVYEIKRSDSDYFEVT